MTAMLFSVQGNHSKEAQFFAKMSTAGYANREIAGALVIAERTGKALRGPGGEAKVRLLHRRAVEFAEINLR